MESQLRQIKWLLVAAGVIVLLALVAIPAAKKSERVADRHIACAQGDAAACR